MKDNNPQVLPSVAAYSEQLKAFLEANPLSKIVDGEVGVTPEKPIFINLPWGDSSLNLNVPKDEFLLDSQVGAAGRATALMMSMRLLLVLASCASRQVRRDIRNVSIYVIVYWSGPRLQAATGTCGISTSA